MRPASNPVRGTLSAQPLVSVIIPTYNRARLVGRAVQSAVGQTLKDIEVVVVDDCSHDATEDALRPWLEHDPRVLFHRLPQNLGAAGAINAALERCRGRFVAVLDSDDEWLADKLQKQLQMFETSPGRIGLVTCDALLYSELGSFLGAYHTRAEHTGLPQMLRGNAILSNTSAVVPRDVLERIGNRDPSLRVVYDWDMWIRILAAGYEVRVVAEPLFRYYIHSQSLTRTTTQRQLVEEMLRLPAKHAELYRRWPKAHSQLLHGLAVSLFLNGMGPDATRLYLRAVAVWPWTRESILGVLMAAAGRRLSGWAFHRLQVRRGDHLSL